MHRIMELSEIKYRLQMYKTAAIALATGLSAQTITAVTSGRNSNPTYRVLVALSDFINDQQAPVKGINGKGTAND